MNWALDHKPFKVGDVVAIVGRRCWEPSVIKTKIVRVLKRDIVTEDKQRWDHNGFQRGRDPRLTIEHWDLSHDQLLDTCKLINLAKEIGVHATKVEVWNVKPVLEKMLEIINKKEESEKSEK
jgi:hypothetical protein